MDDDLVRPLIAKLSRLLAEHSSEIVLAGWPTALLGPVSRFAGILAAAMGKWDEAVRQFDLALPVIGDAPAQVARLRLDKAKALILGGDGKARASAAVLLAQAVKDAEQLGMRQVAQESGRLLTDQ